jgi:hypothetical protein
MMDMGQRLTNLGAVKNNFMRDFYQSSLFMR